MKLWNLLKLLLEKQSITFSSKSRNILDTFTSTIEELEEVNRRIDAKIEMSNKMVADIQATQSELAATKEKNEQVKTKLEKLFL